MTSWLQCPTHGVNTSTSINPAQWNCNEDQCAALANPDISGLGVTISFFMTATMTVLLAWLVLGLGAAFREQRQYMSVLDRRFIFFIRRLIGLKNSRRGGRLSEKWQITLQKLMLALSDTHLLAGLAILITGFTQACDVTIYHYHTVVYLGWTSFSVHLITISVARHYLRANKSLLIWRLVLMFALFGLLFAAMCFTASSAWPTSYHSATQTYFFFDSQVFLLLNSTYMRVWRSDTIFGLLIITLAFVTRLLKLFQTTSDFCSRILRRAPEDLMKRYFQFNITRKHSAQNPISKAWWTFSCWGVMAVYLYMRAIYDIFESLLIELLYLTLALTWAFAEIFSWQNRSRFSQFEGKWGFGQVLPLLLVIAPLFAIPELLEASRAEATSPTSPLAKQSHLFKSESSPDTDVDLELQRLHSLQLSEPEDHNDKSAKTIRPIETFWTDHYYSRISSITKTQVHTGIDVLDDTKAAYRSKFYNTLMCLVLISGLAVFWSITWPKFTAGDTNTFELSRIDTSATFGWFYVLYICLPIFVSPFVLWFLFMAPFSRIIRRVIH